MAEANIMKQPLHYNYLMTILESFSELPKEVIIKEDILRLGIAFCNETLGSEKNYKHKDYLYPLLNVG